MEKKTVKGAGGSKLEWCYIEYIEPMTGESKRVFCKDSPLPNEGAYVMFTLAVDWEGGDRLHCALLGSPVNCVHALFHFDFLNWQQSFFRVL